MTRVRVVALLALGVGLASVFPAELLGIRLRDAISAHDGIVHAGAYAVLAWTACWALWPGLCAEPDWRPTYRRAHVLARAWRAGLVVLGTIVTLSLLGAGVEVLQDMLHTNRTLSRDDIIANTVGATLGSMLWLLMRALRPRR